MVSQGVAREESDMTLREADSESQSPPGHRALDEQAEEVSPRTVSPPRVRSPERQRESQRVAREESERALPEADSAARSPSGHRALAEQAEEVPTRPNTLFLTGGASSRGRQQNSASPWRRGQHDSRIGRGTTRE